MHPPLSAEALNFRYRFNYLVAGAVPEIHTNQDQRTGKREARPGTNPFR
jgi:hypothetical protein